MKLRAYAVACPCCGNVFDVKPPYSLAAEATGLAHRCTWCRRLLLTTIERLGTMRVPNVRAIGPSDRSLDVVYVPAIER